ncbi:Ap-5 Complex Subunit Mu-1, partial [Manis pentadactyla]
MPDASGYIERTGANAIQFQDYSEAIVASMLILEFQATGPRLGKDVSAEVGITVEGKESSPGLWVLGSRFFKSEEIVVSMVILEFGHRSALVLVLCNRKGAMGLFMFRVCMTDIEADGVGS